MCLKMIEKKRKIPIKVARRDALPGDYRDNGTFHVYVVQTRLYSVLQLWRV